MSRRPQVGRPRRFRQRCRVHGRPVSNVQKNLCRIWCGPPPPTLRDRVLLAVWRVEEFWNRHVRYRELYRQLDIARELYRAREMSEEELSEAGERILQRIKDSRAAKQEPGD
ncbi:hypothetical protein GCM10010387_29220 [Streptomyces inusitatus]|uniref:Uncharacterized protein n=1 Tax=Streptomyces inusitatus TaxID=68221 RepID=A0A918Q741_9ACTN|nr:hypothetical protein GCM10010387_29220 [Streptomyces inusitatus]